MIPNQKVEEWRDIALADFARRSISFLQEHQHYDEVVMYANDVMELRKDCITPPEQIHALPDGFEYNFSGFFGQVLGVRRVGSWGKY
jgi:hypothetical protein